MRVQFICKKNELYSFVSYTRRSLGLYNSTSFIVKGLQSRGIEAEIIEVNDNNDIDRNVTRYKPDLVVIEALWVVPEKFDVLTKLHRNVKWAIHLHSHMPFLALEGIAMEWIRAYVDRGIGLIANSWDSYIALRSILNYDQIEHLPNVYIGSPRMPDIVHSDVLDIGCFGAIRPLKNQLLQALAAIKFADQREMPLRFHVNASRIETGGQPVLKNLRALFHNTPRTELIESKWNEPEEFIEYLHGMIDIGMQVSLTETFNVVSADYVTAGIPIVVSKEVAWASDRCKASDSNINSIVDAMENVFNDEGLIKENQQRLASHSNAAQYMWAKYIKKVESYGN